MALINTSSALSVAIQITISTSYAINAVMYTVPAGRKFVGNIGNTVGTGTTGINGAAFYTFAGGATSVALAGSLWQYTLLAGTVVREGSNANTSYIIGIESAA